MLEWLVPALLAMLAGAGLVTQQVLNANLRAGLNSAVWAGFASYIVGTLSVVALALVMREPLPPLTLAARVPAWAWAGGVLGAAFIISAVLLVPRLGAATFIGLLVAGQMLASLVFDHFGLLGLPQRPADPLRLLGVALLIGGVVLVRR